MKNKNHHIELPVTSLYDNLMLSAHRYPHRDAIIYYGNVMSYAELKRQVDYLAGYLQHQFHVAKGDFVALYMQNCPQFIIAYYAILRVGAVVVPINAMSVASEVEHIVEDSGCNVILFGQELRHHLTSSKVKHRIAVTYSEYMDPRTDLPVPDILTVSPMIMLDACVWKSALDQQYVPTIVDVIPDDLAVLPYTSGTTGLPKGCMHTHKSVMHTAIAAPEWCKSPKDNVVLAALPMFHVAGMQNGMNTPIYFGNPIVIMTRWDKRCAAILIERYRVSAWSAISTMLSDFLNQADLSTRDLSSINLLTGGGAAMPKAVAKQIPTVFGVDYIEGYGLTETMAPTHMNPVHNPKAQCLGMPIFDTHAMVIDPETLNVVASGSVGEIVVHGPQVFLGYHNNPIATKEAFVQIEGRRYFRTGDLGYVDDEGYFFMVDRLKRMINVSGYKVWPAEIELLLYAHPGILEACVVSAQDTYRGETVKAIVVKKSGNELKESELIAWAHQNMAAYKVPKRVEFVDQLPKSAAGKVQWRALQEKEKGLTPCRS